MQDLTERFREIEKKGSKLQLRITGKLLNLHGIGAERKQEVRSIVYEQTDIESGTAFGDKGLSKDTKTERVKTETVRTFRRNGNGQLIAPLGGDRGYFKGALKASLIKYGTEAMKQKTSLAYGLAKKLGQGVFIEPAMIEVGSDVSNPLDQPAKFLIQKAGMMPEYYDYVNMAPFEVTLIVESDINEEILLNLLAFVQRLGIGPKRRGQIKIERVERLS